MQRQMFAKGGAAFPDMSGDGRVTQKDILMGRGVIPMQEGGMAPMMPSARSDYNDASARPCGYDGPNGGRSGYGSRGGSKPLRASAV